MEQTIIDRIVADYRTNGSGYFSILYDQNDTVVMEHPKYSGFLLKLSNKEFKTSQIQKKILSSIAIENKNICRIYHTQPFEENGKTRTLEVIDKLKGMPKREYSELELETVIREAKKLHVVLNECSDESVVCLPSIGVLFSNIVDHTGNKTLKTMAERIRDDSACDSFMRLEKPSIIVADMVYENILIDKKTVNFIDLDPLILGPENLQFAILLTSNILMQLQQFKRLSMTLIEEYAVLWGKDVIAREDLIALSIFPLLILAMRQVDIETLPEDPDSMYFKLKTILSFILRELDR